MIPDTPKPGTRLAVVMAEKGVGPMILSSMIDDVIKHDNLHTRNKKGYVNRISSNYISRIKNGHLNIYGIRTETLYLLAKALQVPIDRLLD